MSAISNINSQTISPAIYAQNDVSIVKMEKGRVVPKEFSEFNDLKNIYVDSHVISNLNLKKEHVDKIEFERKERMEESPLGDVDFEQEVKEFDKEKVKEVEGELVFSQANANPQKVEELLK